MLDHLCRELTTKILDEILMKMQVLERQEQLLLINEMDQHGYALIHYMTHLDYSEGVKLLADFGADVNLKVRDTDESPLLIAVAKEFEKMVSVLINNGANFNNND